MKEIRRKSDKEKKRAHTGQILNIEKGSWVNDVQFYPSISNVCL